MTQPTMYYKAFCGPFAVVDKSPERAIQRAVSELAADCGGWPEPGSWAMEQIEACRAREPEIVSDEEAAKIRGRNWDAWATAVINDR